MSRHYNKTHSKKVYVGNIDFDYKENEVKEILQTVGPISGKIEFMRDENTHKFKGHAFVEYKDQESRISALKNLNNIEYNGRKLKINRVKNIKSTSLDEDEESLKLSRDIWYLKSNFENFSDLNEDQKGILFLITKFLCDKYPQEFENILFNQKEEFLTEFLLFQEEYMRKFPNN